PFLVLSVAKNAKKSQSKCKRFRSGCYYLIVTIERVILAGCWDGAPTRAYTHSSPPAWEQIVKHDSSHAPRATQRNPESQRDSVAKPRVARNELPWGDRGPDYNPERVNGPYLVV